jgi:hypothetical protein
MYDAGADLVAEKIDQGKCIMHVVVFSFIFVVISFDMSLARVIWHGYNFCRVVYLKMQKSRSIV